MLRLKEETDNLVGLRNGSSQAFEKIYHSYRGKLYNFIMTLSHGDKYMAEEIVQTTFIKLWEVREQIHPEKSILLYLSTIAKNSRISSTVLLIIPYKVSINSFLGKKFIKFCRQNLC